MDARLRSNRLLIVPALVSLGIAALAPASHAQGQRFYQGPTNYVPGGYDPYQNPVPPPPDPAEAQRLDDEANRLLDRKEYRQAITVLRAAMLRDHNSANVYNDLGAAYMDIGRYDTARGFIAQALRLKPTMRVALRNGGIIVDQTSAAQAIPFYSRVLQQDPKDYQVWAWRAFDYAVVGQTAKALYGYKRSLTIKPNYAKAYHWRGNLELSTGHDSAAYADLRTARKLDPSEGASIAADIRTIINQRQERIAAARRRRDTQFAQSQYQRNRRQIVAVVAQGPAYYQNVYQEARREGDSPAEAERKSQEARERYEKDVALQNAWERGDYASLNKIESGDMSQSEISSYNPDDHPSGDDYNSGRVDNGGNYQSEPEPTPAPQPEPAPEPSSE